MTITTIRLARLKSGMLQWELAKAIGIPESQLSKYETGRTQPSPEILQRIEKALGIPLASCADHEEDAQ